MKIFILTAMLLCPAYASASEVTANTTLRRGTMLTTNNISITEKNTNGQHEFIGQELNRTVYAGHVIDTSYVRSPTLIKRNAQINMVYSFGALQLTAKGRALQTGSKGDLISVMNLSSRKKITAIVTGIDMVEVGK
ncbi:MAG: flagellar basal body P-ring formation chaperone FlgA [Robiginitomaculum sp.]|nr:flagellar basal body P-ring formation chaperone FlgA [Robiginitomaculum sp.]